MTAGPARALLVGGAVPAAIAGGVVSLAFLAVSTHAAAGALVGSVLAIVGLSAGPGLLSISRTLSPPAVMAVALGGYAITMIILGGAYLALLPVSWLSGLHIGLGMVITVAVWLGGQLRAAARLRILAFGTPPDETERASDVADSGSPASPEKPLG